MADKGASRRKPLKGKDVETIGAKKGYGGINDHNIDTTADVFSPNWATALNDYNEKDPMPTSKIGGAMEPGTLDGPGNPMEFTGADLKIKGK